MRASGTIRVASNRPKENEKTARKGALAGTAQVDPDWTLIPRLEEHLRAPDFVDAANAPRVSFQSTDIRIADDGEPDVDGEVTLTAGQGRSAAECDFHGPRGTDNEYWRRAPGA